MAAAVKEMNKDDENPKTITDPLEPVSRNKARTSPKRLLSYNAGHENPLVVTPITNHGITCGFPGAVPWQQTFSRRGDRCGDLGKRATGAGG